MNDLTYETVHDVLVETVPEFRPALESHRQEQNGEVLPHLLFGDLTRFVLAAWERGDRALVDRCLAFLDRAAKSPRPRVSNLVAVSFVENVGPWDTTMDSFIEACTETLRRTALQQGWRGGLGYVPPGPPDIDVYVRVENRDRAVIESFLERYVGNWTDEHVWLDTEPVVEALGRAYSSPSVSFARYGRSHNPEISFVIVAFGRDGSAIFGLSVHGESNPGAEALATRMLDELIGLYESSQGVVVWEEPPPLDLEEWNGLSRLGSRVLVHRRTSQDSQKLRGEDPNLQPTD